MPDTQTVDEVVATRTGNSPLARATVSETFDPSTGRATTDKSSRVEEDQTREGGGPKRVFSDKVQKLFDKLEAPPSDEGDPDEESEAPAHDEGDPDEEPETPAEGEPAPDGETTDETPAGPSELDTIRETATRLETRNKELVAELEAARATPKRERTAREQALVEAEAAYVDEGSVPALRKFLGTILGAAPDSKEVDAEMRGLYADLTARELNVPLDQTQQALRNESRAKLALARDKRERAESEKKAAPADGGEEQQIEKGAQYIDNQLSIKGQSGTSLADEFPLLMTLAEDFDGMAPSRLLATAIKQEYTTGSLDPRLEPAQAIRAVAAKIEAHYTTVRDKIAATLPKTDTTKGDPKAPATAKTSNETRQSHGARTMTNATASKAPATSPKTTQQVAAPKTRKDFKTDAEWKNHLLRKHLPRTA